jgi:OmpA-OmpF porin, OOP family
MRRVEGLIVCVLVACTVAGCTPRRWGKCARYGAVVGGVAGGLAGGLGVTEYEKNPVSTGEQAAGIGGGIAGGILVGTLLGHFICDPEVEAPPPPPARAATPPPPSGKPIVTLHGPQFDFDKSALKPDGKRMVDEAVRIMREQVTLRVTVEGHTDSVGTDAYNQRLSERRAGAVRAYMVEQGIALDRITTKGWGESKPTATNETAEGRAENRRVEIIPAP